MANRADLVMVVNGKYKGRYAIVEAVDDGVLLVCETDIYGVRVGRHQFHISEEKTILHTPPVRRKMTARCARRKQAEMLADVPILAQKCSVGSGTFGWL